jgi:3-oxoadipate enol-lactonase
MTGNKEKTREETQQILTIYKEVVMPYLEDNGVKLWYSMKGEGEPLVLTGGFLCLHNQWDWIEKLLIEDFRIINWNYRGAGQSDLYWAGGYSFDRWVDDLEYILNALSIEHVNLWGTSTGSTLTIRYAAKYQNRVKSMITYPQAKLDPTYRQAFKFFQDIGEAFGHEGLARFTSWFGSAEHNRFSDEGNRLGVHEHETFKENISIESLAKTCETYSHIDLTSELEKIEVPTLLLLGESGFLGSDNPSVAKAMEEFQEHCKHAQVTTIKDAGGTYCMFEKPKETAEAVKEFIKSIP